MTTASMRAVSPRIPPAVTVVKVGGALLESPTQLERIAAAIVRRRRQASSLLVVASALKGVTDLLASAALQALDQRSEAGLGRMIATLRRRHESFAADLADRGALARVRGQLDEIERSLGAIRDTGELSDHGYAQLLSSGERLSVPLVAAAIRAAGQDARAITAEELGLRATGSPLDGRCDVAGSHEGFRKVSQELKRRVMVLTGFYGVDREGRVVLFGRGGSDDTGCAVAAGLDADRLELWKDVPGFMSADPFKVRDAHLVPTLSFDEVAQLGAFGSAVLHHRCLEPLRGRSTEIVICSLDDGPHPDGTRLVDGLRRKQAGVVALTTHPGASEFQLLNGHAPGASGLTGRVLSALGDAGIPVKTMNTRKTSIQFTVADSNVERTTAVLRRLGDYRCVVVGCSPSLVGAVGDGLAGDAETGSRMLRCLSELGIRDGKGVEATGRSGLSCAIRQDELLPALNGLHEHFFAALRDGAP